MVASVFGSDFQGGLFVEVLGTQGTNALSQWKVQKVQKVYDKAVKGSVYGTTSGNTLKLQAPKDEKTVLGLVQPFLVLQVSLQGQPLTVELVVQDTSGTRRRMILSSSFTDAKVTPLHCQIPFAAVARGAWLNLTLPLAELTSLFFKGAMYLSVDSLVISGTCKLRRVFTLRDPPYNVQAPGDQTMGPQPLPLPKGLELPAELDVFTQVLDTQSLQSMGVQLPNASTAQPRGPPTRNGQETQHQRPAHLVTPVHPHDRVTLGLASPSASLPPYSPQLMHSFDDDGLLPVQPPLSGPVSQDSLRRRETQPSSWATAVTRQPPTPTQPPATAPPAKDNSPLAQWDANATEGGMRGSAGRSAARHAAESTVRADANNTTALLKSLLPPTPAFAGSGVGRPTTDSVTVLGSSVRARTGPTAGRRAISALVTQRADPTTGSNTSTTAQQASPARNAPMVGRRRGSPNSVTEGGGLLARTKSPSITQHTSLAPAPSLSSSNSLDLTQQPLAQLPDASYAALVIPGSPNTRYGRRAGGATGAATAGVNIPCTIKEGEAMNGTPQVSGSNQTQTQQQQAAGPGQPRGNSQQAGRRPRAPGSPVAGSARGANAGNAPPSSAGGRGNSRGGPGHSTATVGCAASPARLITSPPLPSAPSNTNIPPQGLASQQRASITLLPQQGPGNALIGGTAPRSASPARALETRGQLRSPPKRDPNTLLARKSITGLEAPVDLDGVLHVRGGVDASADLGVLLPRLSVGMTGSGAPSSGGMLLAGRMSRSSLTGDLPLAMHGLTSAQQPSQQADTQPYFTGSVFGNRQTAVQGDKDAALLPSLDRAGPVALMQSVSMSRDRYARQSSSSSLGNHLDAPTHVPSAHPVPSSRAAPLAPSRRSPPRSMSPSPSNGGAPAARPAPTQGSHPASPPSRLPAASLAPVSTDGTPSTADTKAKSVTPPSRQQPARRVSPARGAQPPSTTSGNLAATNRTTSPSAVARVGLTSPSRGHKPPTNLPVAPGRTASPGRGTSVAAGTTPAAAHRPVPAGRGGRGAGGAAGGVGAAAGRGARVGSTLVAAARGMIGNSVASSVCEVDESVNLVAGWGGFGVDEDDVLADHHVRHAATARLGGASTLPARHTTQRLGAAIVGMQQDGGVGVGVGVGMAPAASGLKVDGLGAPIWSNENPSTRAKPTVDSLLDDSVLHGDVTLPGTGSGMMATVGTAAGTGTAGVAGGGMMQGTFAFPTADTSMMETAALHHGGYGDSGGRPRHTTGVAMGGPLRRYTVDDDTLLASNASMRWQGHDTTDWAHVEQLMAAPVDLAAAARAYTPPVVLPSQVLRPSISVSDSDRSSGPQVLAVRHSQEPGKEGNGVAGVKGVAGSSKAGGQTQAGRLAGGGRGAAGGKDNKAGVRPRAQAQQHPKEEMLDLMYDPLLNCYYDHKTGNYWQLAAPS